MKTKLIIALFSIVLVATVKSQNKYFEEIPSTHFSNFEGVQDGDIAFADIDNDNDLDVLITGLNNSDEQSSKLYINDGAGNYSFVPNTPFEGGRYSSIAFADVDNDNDQDVLISGRNSSLESITKLYINNGSGIFTEQTEVPFDDVSKGSIAFSDIDNDNDQDILITGENNSNERIAKLYTNDGNGNYIEQTGMPFDGVFVSSIAFADIDNDNDQDVLITGFNNSSISIAKLYTNDGNGNYIEQTETPFAGVTNGDIAFADIDNDNDQDVLITGSFRSKLYINDGFGTFSLQTETPFIGTSSGTVAFADIDNDNDQDVLLSGYSADNTNPTILYINDGVGNYSIDNDHPFEGGVNPSIAFADIDNDNDQDVLITAVLFSTEYSKHYTNDGSGNFTGFTWVDFDNVANGSAIFADIDNDNDQDVLITGKNDANDFISKLYANDGNGNYFLIKNTPFYGADYCNTVFVDYDNDNDQDVFISGRYSTLQQSANLYKNDGLGNYSEVLNTPFEGGVNSPFAFADIDNDDDLDLFINGVLYTNEGNDIFTAVTDTSFDELGFIETVSFADIDNDNDQDLFINSSFFINDGFGNYTESNDATFEELYPGSVIFFDIDNDNDLDLLIFGGSESNGAISKLYINDGTGNYSENADVPFEGLLSSSVAFVDIDNDYDLDVFAMGINSSDEAISKLYLNNGSGNFTVLTDMAFEGLSNGSIAFADIDNDNDNDILITGGDGFKATTILYRNKLITPFGILENKVKNEISIYPNPTKSKITVDCVGLEQIEIVDITGKTIKQYTSKKDQLTIDLSDQTKGIYIVKVSTKKGVSSQKVIIE